MAKKQAPKDPLLVKFAQNLKQAKKNSGLTNYQIKYEYGLDLSWLRRIESGRPNITLLTLFHLACIFKSTPSEILKGVSKTDCQD